MHITANDLTSKQHARLCKEVDAELVVLRRDFLVDLEKEILHKAETTLERRCVKKWPFNFSATETAAADILGERGFHVGIGDINNEKSLLVSW